jgi:hypothetical protein
MFASARLANLGLRVQRMLPLPGLQAGRLWVSEGNSVLPRDRLSALYNHASGVNLSTSELDVDRGVLGIEKTIFQQLASVELRLPLSSSLSNDIQLDRDRDSRLGEMGNFIFVFKGLFYDSPSLSVAGGAGVTFPTGNDVIVSSAVTGELLRVTNDSLHVQPFLAAAWAPWDGWFVQSFLQFDIDAVGNSVAPFVPGQGPFPIGVLTDPALLRLDLQAGYWVYRAHSPDQWITGLAPFLEFHGTYTVGDVDRVSVPGLTVQGEPRDRTTLTLGLNVDVCKHSSLLLGVTLPLNNRADRLENVGFSVLFNYHFEYLTRLLHSPNF